MRTNVALGAERERLLEALYPITEPVSDLVAISLKSCRIITSPLIRMVKPVLNSRRNTAYDFHPYDAEDLTDGCGWEVHLYPVYFRSARCILPPVSVILFLLRSADSCQGEKL